MNTAAQLASTGIVAFLVALILQALLDHATGERF